MVSVFVMMMVLICTTDLTDDQFSHIPEERLIQKRTIKIENAFVATIVNDRQYFMIATFTSDFFFSSVCSLVPKEKV